MRLGGRGKAGRFGELGGKEMIGRRRTERKQTNRSRSRGKQD